MDERKGKKGGAWSLYSRICRNKTMGWGVVYCGILVLGPIVTLVEGDTLVKGVKNLVSRFQPVKASSRLREVNSQRGSQARSCWKCGQQGHYKKQCTQPDPPRQPQGKGKGKGKGRGKGTTADGGWYQSGKGGWFQGGKGGWQRQDNGKGSYERYHPYRMGRGNVNINIGQW